MDKWAVRATFIKLAADARQQGYPLLVMMYQMSAIQLGNEHLDTVLERMVPRGKE